MSFDKISKLTSSVAHYLDDSEKLPLPLLAVKAKKAFEANPDDPTITSMANVLGRMAGQKLFISRGELKQLYKGFYSRNNKFAEVFSDELGAQPQLKGPTFAARESDGNTASDFNKYSDPILANALESAFDTSKPMKNYSRHAATAALEMVKDSFAGMSVPARFDVVTGSTSMIVVQATVETPKGQTSIYVPVEVVSDKVLLPELFMANAGVTEFSKENVIAYVVKNAGSKLTITAAMMENLVSKATAVGGSFSNVELAMTKLAASKETQGEFFANQVTHQSVDQVSVRDVVLPTAHDAEISSFADHFDSPIGRATFKFGERKVVASRELLTSEFRSLGYGTPQVSVADSTNDTVVFAISLGKTAFTVPFKMNGNETPSVFVVNGSVRELTKENIAEVVKEETFDHRAAAATSPLYNSKPSDLIENIRQAMAERNFSKAEDALNVLATCGDAKAYQSGMAAYMGNLGVKTASAESECKCSRIIRHAHSRFPVCGHTGLPTHKVYQDKNGDCQPLYRKAMDETYQGAYFMNSKIFF